MSTPAANSTDTPDTDSSTEILQAATDAAADVFQSLPPISVDPGAPLASVPLLPPRGTDYVTREELLTGALNTAHRDAMSAQMDSRRWRRISVIATVSAALVLLIGAALIVSPPPRETQTVVHNTTITGTETTTTAVTTTDTATVTSTDHTQITSTATGTTTTTQTQTVTTTATATRTATATTTVSIPAPTVN